MDFSPGARLEGRVTSVPRQTKTPSPEAEMDDSGSPEYHRRVSAR